MKKIFLSILCFLTILFSSGCSCEAKVALTKDQFVQICEENNYQTTDITTQYAQFTQIESAVVATSGTDWQIEFYVLDSVDNAKAMYATNQSIFENSASGSSSYSSVTLKNYSTFQLKANGYYMYLSQVDATLLYVKVAETYETAVVALVDALGY